MAKRESDSCQHRQGSSCSQRDALLCFGAAFPAGQVAVALDFGLNCCTAAMTFANSSVRIRSLC
ncbi:hypothetical protein CLOSTMETH_00923 [[Clostridium] methylpentosum DSM 5476]|uniref:Uncharacterized protein n=1 Tax=[Clostridium] methylpentosum DSM 5476 TaxID=537013 RepID=C0EAQ9_9FIRM|nr:hypothetical protein CLOSTMETH_00923 [[Clostridium] methylpentosum DSM 5476]